MFNKYTKDDFYELGRRVLDEEFPEDIPLVINNGRFPVLFVASHSVTHQRNGRIKMGECITGAIVEGLSRDLDCYGCYKTYNYNDDPNWDKDNYIKGNIFIHIEWEIISFKKKQTEIKI